MQESRAGELEHENGLTQRRGGGENRGTIEKRIGQAGLLKWKTKMNSRKGAKAQRRSGASMKTIGTRTRAGTLTAMTGASLLLTGKSASSNLQNEIFGDAGEPDFLKDRVRGLGLG